MTDPTANCSWSLRALFNRLPMTAVAERPRRAEHLRDALTACSEARVDAWRVAFGLFRRR